MSKALLGSHVDPTTLRLLDEVRALRRRVADLEAALAAAEAARDERDDQRQRGDAVTVDLAGERTTAST
jgi:50S ribosomal subunit-associated GTPase HflX